MTLSLLVRVMISWNHSMHYDIDEIEKLAREIHAHSWVSFLKWDSSDLSDECKNMFRAKAISGKITKLDTKDGYVPKGMELVERREHAPTPIIYKPRNEIRPSDSMVFMPHSKKLNNIDSINDVLTENSQPKKRRGRPPGSKNKK